MSALSSPQGGNKIQSNQATSGHAINQATISNLDGNRDPSGGFVEQSQHCLRFDIRNITEAIGAMGISVAQEVSFDGSVCHFTYLPVAVLYGGFHAFALLRNISDYFCSPPEVDRRFELQFVIFAFILFSYSSS